MKLDRLAGMTPRPSPESMEPARHGDPRIRRVEALQGVEGDRQRSLQQEMAEIEAAAIGEFNGSEQALQGARDVAAQLAALGAALDDLIKPAGLPAVIPGVDDTA